MKPSSEPQISTMSQLHLVHNDEELMIRLYMNAVQTTDQDSRI